MMELLVRKLLFGERQGRGALLDIRRAWCTEQEIAAGLEALGFRRGRGKDMERRRAGQRRVDYRNQHQLFPELVNFKTLFGSIF